MTVGEQRTMDAIQSINSKIPELTIRDLFAMSALAGLAACPEVDGGMEHICELAYDYADEMMSRRKAI